MAERKNISKKMRFEIFKRDQFTCQYCGKQPPEVVLEIDHINPVVNGGDNDPMNLITACFDCNRGKGKNRIENITPRPDADLEWLSMQQEIAELKRYQKAKTERDNEIDKVINLLQGVWSYAFDEEYVPKEHYFARLLKSMSPEIIEKAIYIASGNGNLSCDMTKRFKYVCGICWNLVKQGDSD